MRGIIIAIFASLFLGFAVTATAAGSAPIFEGRVVKEGDVDLAGYVGKMRGVAVSLLMIMIVCAGVLAASGKSQLAVAVAMGAIFLFGGGWIILEIGKAVGRL